MNNGRSRSGGIGGELVPNEWLLGISLLEQADLLGELAGLDIGLRVSWGGPSGSGLPDPSRFGIQSSTPLQPPPSSIFPNSGGYGGTSPAPSTLPQFNPSPGDTLTGATYETLIGTPTTAQGFSLRSEPTVSTIQTGSDEPVLVRVIKTRGKYVEQGFQIPKYLHLWRDVQIGDLRFSTRFYDLVRQMRSMPAACGSIHGISRFPPVLIALLSLRREDFNRICGIDRESGGGQAYGEKAANALDPEGSTSPAASTDKGSGWGMEEHYQSVVFRIKTD